MFDISFQPTTFHLTGQIFFQRCNSLRLGEFNLIELQTISRFDNGDDDINKNIVTIEYRLLTIYNRTILYKPIVDLT